MYKFKKIGYIICDKRTKNFRIISQSENWKIWRAVITPGTCYYCASMHGRILPIDSPECLEIPVHPNCRCYTEFVSAILAGTATTAGSAGADLYVALNGTLPDYYITQSDAKKLGWKKLLGNLTEVLPERVIGGDVYKNRDHRLPEASGRVWYEADFDYVSGYRNNSRLLFSNDGLLFVTYDHYLTFYEIWMDETIGSGTENEGDAI